MPSTDHLDPHEVLSHLHHLGYTNITPKQLKEFMYDLKKLIKHDQKRQDNNKENVDSFDQPSSPCQCCTCSEKEESLMKFKGFRRTSTSSYSNMEDSYDATLQGNTTSTETNSPPVYAKPDSAHVYIKEPKKFHPPQRPKSSFIRPWQIQATGTGLSYSNAFTKSDPVALYHKYKEIWNMQKPPGENGHSDLRWSIREKMLGQDPNPRPTSRASSIERRKGVHNL